MWKNFDPTPYTRDQYQAHVEILPSITWPKFIVLHNTGSPTLAQWMDGGVSEAQRLINLEFYYEHTEGWHSGPHAFIPPTHICGFADPTKPGVHASCFNSVSLGFEMVGDYSVDDFTTGNGALVRDNAVFTLALWHRKLGLRPDGYRYGISGLHFHKDCLRDHHDCPGKHVDRADMVARVLAAMAAMGSSGPIVMPKAPSALPSPPVASAAPLSTYLRVGSTGKIVSDVQEVLGIVTDGVYGPATAAAVEAFQKTHGLVADGIVGPQTMTALRKG